MEVISHEGECLRFLQGTFCDRCGATHLKTFLSSVTAVMKTVLPAVSQYDLWERLRRGSLRFMFLPHAGQWNTCTMLIFYPASKCLMNWPQTQ